MEIEKWEKAIFFLRMTIISLNCSTLLVYLYIRGFSLKKSNYKITIKCKLHESHETSYFNSE